MTEKKKTFYLHEESNCDLCSKGAVQTGAAQMWMSVLNMDKNTK